jgi:hypothetical protein
MPLKPDFKAMGLAALRSGLYTQYHGSAGGRHVNAYCCIAVFAVATGFPNKTWLSTQECAKYIGLTQDELEEWYRWNDIQRKTFPKIANLIEEKY